MNNLNLTNTAIPLKNLSKQMSTLMSAAGSNIAIDEKKNKKNKNKYAYNLNGKDYYVPNIENRLSLLNFSRLYKIGQIPIMDFIIIYIILCILNAIYFNYDYKFMLILTIPLTILSDIIFIKNIKTTKLLLIIFLVSIIYLIHMDRNK